MTSRTLHAALVAMLAIATTACASDTPAAPLFSGSSVEIVGAPADSVLLTDAELQLSAVVRSTDGTEITGAQPRWSTTDASRATVSAEGRVSGVGPGAVRVRVSAAGATAERALSVRTRVPLPGASGPPRTTSMLDGAVQITLNAGAVSGATALHIRAAEDPPSDARLVNNTAVEIGPLGVTFKAGVTLALSYPSSIASAEQPLLRVHQLTNGAWVRVPGGSVDLSARRVSAAIARTGTYALLRPAGAATLLVDAGDGQRALAGTFVAIAPRVMVRDADDNPVEGASIRFAVTAGGGTIVGTATTVTGADGRASLPGQWRLGPTVSINTLSAEVVGSSVAPVTFTATLEVVSLIVTRQLAGAVSGRVATTQPRLEFRTAGGALVSLSDSVGVELVSGSGALLGTARVSAVNGVATFVDLRLDGTGAHQLRFTSGSRVAVGAVFTVTQELARLEIIVQPAGAVDNVAFTTQPVIKLYDDAGLAFLPPTSVTAKRESGPGDLRGTRTLTSVGGIVTFTNLRIDDDGVHQLRFEAGSPERFVLSELLTVIPD